MLFTTGQALGAIPNGTIVEKINSVPGDAHQDGAWAKVIGSIAVKEELIKEGLEPIDYAYFVEWDDLPGIFVGIAGHRIRRL